MENTVKDLNLQDTFHDYLCEANIIKAILPVTFMKNSKNFIFIPNVSTCTKKLTKIGDIFITSLLFIT